MLAVYTSHDRELLFHGSVEEARAAGIRIHRATREITINGERRLIVNSVSEPNYLGLWVVNRAD